MWLSWGIAFPGITGIPGKAACGSILNLYFKCRPSNIYAYTVLPACAKESDGSTKKCVTLIPCKSWNPFKYMMTHSATKSSGWMHFSDH